MQARLKQILLDSSDLKRKFAENSSLIETVSRCADQLLKTARSHGTIFTCGNGGSTCDAMHFCEELVGVYKSKRPGIKAMHFMDPSVLTCWSNDRGFDGVFERYAETFCGPNDTLVAISTSGKSPNILNALKTARKRGTYCIGLSGRDGGEMKDLCNEIVIVPSQLSERIQEVHITIIHAWCEILDSAS